MRFELQEEGYLGGAVCCGAEVTWGVIAVCLVLRLQPDTLGAVDC